MRASPSDSRPAGRREGAAGGPADDYFALFSLPVRYRVDLEDLARRHRTLQVHAHPDRFAGAGERERRLALQYSGLANEAYEALRDPVRRAAHILGQGGIDPFDETDTRMSGEFLARQLEVREELEEARDDLGRLRRLKGEVAAGLADYEERLGALLDDRKDLEGATRAVREMRYLDKALSEIGGMVARLEDG